MTTLSPERLDALDDAIARVNDVSLALNALSRLAGYDGQPDMVGALTALADALSDAAIFARRNIRPGGDVN